MFIKDKKGKGEISNSIKGIKVFWIIPEWGLLFINQWNRVLLQKKYFTFKIDYLIF